MFPLAYLRANWKHVHSTLKPPFNLWFQECVYCGLWVFPCCFFVFIPRIYNCAVSLWLIPCASDGSGWRFLSAFMSVHGVSITTHYCRTSWSTSFVMPGRRRMLKVLQEVKEAICHLSCEPNPPTWILQERLRDDLYSLPKLKTKEWREGEELWVGLDRNYSHGALLKWILLMTETVTFRGEIIL